MKVNSLRFGHNLFLEANNIGPNQFGNEILMTHKGPGVTLKVTGVTKGTFEIPNAPKKSQPGMLISGNLMEGDRVLQDGYRVLITDAEIKKHDGFLPHRFQMVI